MNKFILPILLLSFVNTRAQLPDTDIFLADIKNHDGEISISNPENITNRKGYDNQPYFTPDGKNILYVSIVDTNTADIYKYDLSSKKHWRITSTKESEYSPTYSDDLKSISTVRVDEDGGQRFYNLSLANPKSATLVTGTDAIGYYCWLRDSLLAMFILGDAMTLQVLNTHSHERKLIASNIGRCMKLSIDKKYLLFVIKQNESEWSLFKMDIATNAISKIAETLKNNEDFALMPDGTFLMGSEGKLYQYKPGSDQTWKMIADLSLSVKSFYRIAINTKGNRIAFVAYSGQKP